MDTITENKLDTLTVKASEFNDLLLGASVAMDKGKGATDNLASLYLTAKGDGYLMAYASDRYRLIEGKFELDSGTLAECQLRVNDVKNILATIKANKLAGEITLTRAGDSLSLAIGSTSLNVILGGSKFPPYAHLFELEPKPIDKIMLNPTYLASFDKVPASDAGNTFTFYGEGKPVGVNINHTRISWRALLMPMKIR
jgi:DNA polymerase III sliding clamp (beta) subunit (PCNA family)